MNEPWAIESILNGTGGGGGGGGNPIPPITNIYVPVDEWKYQDRIIDVVGFPWVADVPYPNVKASDFVSVIFGQEDAESGIFSNVCESRTDAVRIFASEKPSKRIRIDTLSGFRPNASNSIWGHITGDIQTQQDLVDFVGDSNKIESIKANGTELEITDKAVNIPLATVVNAGLNFAYDSTEHKVYVSPDGDDTTGDGTSTKPWRQIQTAINKTKDYNSKLVTIYCAAGNYNNISINSYINHVYQLYLNGDVITTGGEFLIANTDLIITGTSTSTLSVTSTDRGISVNGFMNFTVKGISALNITAERYGITTVQLVGVMVLSCEVNITLTANNAHSGVSLFNYGRLHANKITVNSDYNVGFALSIQRFGLGIVNSLIASINKYAIGVGSMLAIGGQWVNQS